MCWTGREGLDSWPLLDVRSGYHLRPWDVSDWVILWAVVCPAVTSWRGSKMAQPVGCLACEKDLSLIPSTHVRQSGLIVHTWNMSSQCWGDRCEHIPEGRRPFTLTKSVSFKLETPHVQNKMKRVWEMSPRLTSDLDIHAHTCALYTGIHEQTNEHPAVHVPHTYPLRPRKDFSFRCRSMNAITVLLGFSNVNKEMKCGVLCHVGWRSSTRVNEALQPSAKAQSHGR